MEPRAVSMRACLIGGAIGCAVAAATAFWRWSTSEPSPQPLSAEPSELLRWAETRWEVSRKTISNGAVAITIDNFLPDALAERWYQEFATSWRRAAPCREAGECSGAACAWLYTSNDKGGNEKVRSVRAVEERQRRVRALYDRGHFAYSKWELSRAHPLHDAVGELMDSADMRQVIGRAMGFDPVGAPLGDISDYFLTAYARGDFLSNHNDAFSGSLAWVMQLSRAWNAEDGGALRFQAGAQMRRPLDFMPAFNRLLLFVTRPHDIPHQVLPVLRNTSLSTEMPRFGMTGWYMTHDDRFDAVAMEQFRLMRTSKPREMQCD